LPFHQFIGKFEQNIAKNVMSSAKLQVRHILFKKIVFLIFLNNLVTVHCARAYCLKRKKQKKRFFLSKVCLTCNFTEALKMLKREVDYA
jgi:hypothetical protein